jgi:hypothetical protein
VIRAEDSQTIDRSKFASVVESEMILEMSIVMRQKMAFQDSKGNCPRCGHLNLNVAPTNGWIEWQVPLLITHKRCIFIFLARSRGCPGQFKVSVNEFDDKNHRSYGEAEIKDCDEERKENLESGEEHTGSIVDGDGRGQEIISPASYDLLFHLSSD